MDLRQISAFVAVAEAQSFTKAARRLYISQPPLSRQIRQLEVELGVALFVRHHRGIELTTAGRILLEKARTAAEAATDLREAAEELKDPGVRAVQLGVAWGLWSVVERIRAHHSTRVPEARIAVSDLCPLPRAEAQSERDAVIVRAPVDHSKYESCLLFHERLVAVLGATHALASHKRLRLADLASEPLLMYERAVDPGLYDKTSALYAAAGVRPHIVEAQPAPCTLGALMLVASCQGFYLATASPFTQTHRTSGVTVVPVDEPDARVEVRIAWPKRDLSGRVSEFLRSARDVFPLKQRERVASSEARRTHAECDGMDIDAATLHRAGQRPVRGGAVGPVA